MKTRIALFFILLLSVLIVSNERSAEPIALVSSFNMGFAQSNQGSVELQSVVGQSFVGRSKNDNTTLESGFLAHISGLTTSVSGENAIPTVFDLRQNYPNPFNPSTTIPYQLPKETDVNIKIFNMRGQLVRVLVDEKQQPGYYNLIWDGHDDYLNPVSSGVYFYRMKTDEFEKIRRMTFIK